MKLKINNNCIIFTSDPTLNKVICLVMNISSIKCNINSKDHTKNTIEKANLFDVKIKIKKPIIVIGTILNKHFALLVNFILFFICNYFIFHDVSPQDIPALRACPAPPIAYTCHKYLTKYTIAVARMRIL